LIAFFGVYKDFLKVSNFQKYILLSFLISMLVYSSAVNGTISNNFNGFLGVYDLSPIVSFIVTFLIYVMIINAVSRMQRISGYNIIFGIMFFVSLKSTYHLNYLHTLNTISTIIIAICVLFLLINIKNQEKIFIGNSGSFFLGFWIAYFLIQYINESFNYLNIYNIKDENFPIIAMALISIPILDTLRIIFLRIYWLYSPFKSDKKWHIHDILIESGMSHIRTSLFLTIINFFNAILIFLIESNFNSYYLISIYFSVSIFWLLFFEFIRRRFSKINS